MIAAIITVITTLLRLIGLAETAERLFGTYQASQTQKAADKAGKAIVDEDHRKLDIAARPDRSPDDILGRMSDGDL